MVAPAVVQPKDVPDTYTIWRGFLTNEAGATDMRVDGSSTTQEFFVGAPQNADRYIISISFVIADAAQTLNEFGNLGSALANGCKLYYQTERFTEVVISDTLTTNFEFVRLSGGNPAFGDAANSFRASNVSSTSEGYIPTLRMMDMFGVPIRLKSGTSQRLVMAIRDDVTGVDQFDVIAYGYDRI